MNFFFTFLAVSTMVVEGVQVILIASRIEVYPAPSFIKPFVSGCMYEEKSGIIGGIFIVPLIFETAVCIATFVKAVQHWHTLTFRNSPLFQTLYYDGFVYFLFIFGVAFANLFVWYLVPATLGMLVIILYRVSMCVMGSRIILHIRIAGALLSDREEFANRTTFGRIVCEGLANAQQESPSIQMDNLPDRPP